MLGQIFFSLQKFAQRQFGPTVWVRLFTEAGLPPKLYLPTADYPDAEAIALVRAASRVSGQPVEELLEAFGTAIAADLMALYRSIIRPDWRTLDLIANAEEVIHTAIRHRNPAATPPVLQCLRLGDTDMQVVYASERRLCALAKGIIRGVAAHYREAVQVVEHTCMHAGDPCCTILVTVAPRPAAEPPAAIAAPAPTPAPSAQDTLVRADSWAGLSPARTGGGPSAGADPPEHIGPYRVLGRLGVGGMGAVYLAEDAMLGRRVALKLMLPQVAAVAENRERFLGEARALAALTSDHVVPIYQVGMHGGQPYIAMPVLQGETLEDRLTVIGRLPFAAVARIGGEIATGLADAHEAGIVHRDIKPSNIWLEEGSDRVKVLDFGTARGGTSLPPLTRSGMLIGTPHYMAPERAAGEPVDGRADLFSLGVIVYQMAAGHLPFRGKSDFAVMQAIADVTPDPLARVVEGVPGRLSDLVGRLLAKTPDERPPSARGVAAEFARLAADPVGTPDAFAPSVGGG